MKISTTINFTASKRLEDFLDTLTLTEQRTIIYALIGAALKKADSFECVTVTNIQNEKEQ